MSRTKKTVRSPTKEYWTARPGNVQGGKPGKTTKKKTHKAERRLSKLGLGIKENHEEV